jgi:hypothetical protein
VTKARGNRYSQGDWLPDPPQNVRAMKVYAGSRKDGDGSLGEQTHWHHGALATGQSGRLSGDTKNAKAAYHDF